jgi:hypothetical protein
LRAYFDNVQHYLLLEKVARRVKDEAVMHLLKMMLKATGKQGVPQGGVITPFTQKVIWGTCLVWRYATALWGSLWHCNAMANGDGIVSYLNVFDDEAYDSLSLGDTQRISSTAQADEERRKGFRKTQEGFPIVGLVSHCLQLSTKRLFALAQCRHTLTQLFDRKKCFLVGAQKSFDALANMH